MINFKLVSAKKKDIVLNTNVNVPANLPLNEYDLGILIGNLVDNAIEAIEKIEIEKRYLNIEIAYEPDYVVIKVANPFNQEVLHYDNNYESTKEDKENHGYGLKNIIKIVEKHHGIIKINHDHGIFDVDIALLIPVQS